MEASSAGGADTSQPLPLYEATFRKCICRYACVKALTPNGLWRAEGRGWSAGGVESELKNEIWAWSPGPGFEFHLYCHPGRMSTMSPWHPTVLLPPSVSRETIGGTGWGQLVSSPCPALRTVGGLTARSCPRHTLLADQARRARPGVGQARRAAEIRTHARKRPGPSGLCPHSYKRPPS